MLQLVLGKTCGHETEGSMLVVKCCHNDGCLGTMKVCDDADDDVETLFCKKRFEFGTGGFKIEPELPRGQEDGTFALVNSSTVHVIYVSLKFYIIMCQNKVFKKM